MFNESGSSVSPNPMDVSCGGQAYTESLIYKEYYAVDKVYYDAWKVRCV